VRWPDGQDSNPGVNYTSSVRLAQQSRPHRQNPQRVQSAACYYTVFLRDGDLWSIWTCLTVLSSHVGAPVGGLHPVVISTGRAICVLASR